MQTFIIPDVSQDVWCCPLTHPLDLIALTDSYNSRLNDFILFLMSTWVKDSPDTRMKIKVLCWRFVAEYWSMSFFQKRNNWRTIKIRTMVWLNSHNAIYPNARLRAYNYCVHITVKTIFKFSGTASAVPHLIADVFKKVWKKISITNCRKKVLNIFGISITIGL